VCCMYSDLGNELGNVTLTFFSKALKCLSCNRGGDSRAVECTGLEKRT